MSAAATWRAFAWPCGTKCVEIAQGQAKARQVAAADIADRFDLCLPRRHISA